MFNYYFCINFEFNRLACNVLMQIFSISPQGQTSNAPPDVSSITALNEVIPTDHVTLKSVYLESQSLAYQNTSLSPSPKPEITPTASPPSRANSETPVHGNSSTSQTPELEDVTTLMMEAASAPGKNNIIKPNLIPKTICQLLV